MSWTAPRTWTTGEVVTAAIMNQHIRDEFLGLAPTNFRANFTPATQTIATGTLTALSGWTALWDSDVGYAAGSPTRYTCKSPGFWLIHALAIWQPNTGTERGIVIRLNGGAEIGGQRLVSVATNPGVECAALYRLALNDYLEVCVYQTSGGNLNVFASEATTGMQSSFSAARFSI